MTLTALARDLGEILASSESPVEGSGIEGFGGMAVVTVHPLERRSRSELPGVLVKCWFPILGEHAKAVMDFPVDWDADTTIDMDVDIAERLVTAFRQFEKNIRGALELAGAAFVEGLS